MIGSDYNTLTANVLLMYSIPYSVRSSEPATIARATAAAAAAATSSGESLTSIPRFF